MCSTFYTCCRVPWRRYVVFDKGTVWPESVTGGMEHMQTWKVAYYLEGVRDRLFTQWK